MPMGRRHAEHVEARDGGQRAGISSQEIEFAALIVVPADVLHGLLGGAAEAAP